jgi:hypothetical protein
MLTQTKPRRSSGLVCPMRRLLSLFLLQDGRKVGFGLWVFVASGGFLLGGKITATDWLTCVFLSSGLIGGGTVLDSYLKGKNDPPPGR